LKNNTTKDTTMKKNNTTKNTTSLRMDLRDSYPADLRKHREEGSYPPDLRKQLQDSIPMNTTKQTEKKAIYFAAWTARRAAMKVYDAANTTLNAAREAHDAAYAAESAAWDAYCEASEAPQPEG